MEKTKTAVILSIVTIILLGGVLYALKDNFKSVKSSNETSTNE